MKKFDRRIKKAWIANLRSGDFPQVRSFLCRNDGFCCMGVLSWMLQGSKRVPDGYEFVIRDHEWYGNVFGVWLQGGKRIPNSGSGWIPEAILKKIGLTVNNQTVLAKMNDGGNNFHEIADWIEKNL